MTDCIICGKPLTESRSGRNNLKCIRCTDDIHLIEAKVLAPTSVLCRGCHKIWKEEDPSLCTCKNRASESREKAKNEDVQCKGLITQSKSNRGTQCKFKARRKDFNGYCNKHQAQARRADVSADMSLCTYRKTCCNPSVPGKKWCQEHILKDREKYSCAFSTSNLTSDDNSTYESDDNCNGDSASTCNDSNNPPKKLLKLVPIKLILKPIATTTLMPATAISQTSQVLKPQVLNRPSLGTIPKLPTKTYAPVVVPLPVPKPTSSGSMSPSSTASSSTTTKQIIKPFKVTPPTIVYVPKLTIRKFVSGSLDQILNLIDNHTETLYKMMKYKAQSSLKAFNLTINETRILSMLPCTFCDTHENTHIHLIDINGDYTVSNIQQICETCDIMKKGFNDDTFIQASSNVYLKSGISNGANGFYLHNSPTFQDYLLYSRDYDIAFNLSQQEFDKLTHSSCFLCGHIPGCLTQQNLIIEGKGNAKHYQSICLQCIKLLKDLDADSVKDKCTKIHTTQGTRPVITYLVNQRANLITIVKNFCKNANYFDIPTFLQSSTMYYISKVWTGSESTYQNVQFEFEVCNRNPILLDLWKWYRINLCKLVSIFNPTEDRDSHLLLIRDMNTKTYVGIIGMDWHTSENKFRVHCCSSIGDYEKYDKVGRFYHILRSKDFISYISDSCKDKILIEKKNLRPYSHLSAIPEEFSVRSRSDLCSVLVGSKKVESDNLLQLLPEELIVNVYKYLHFAKGNDFSISHKNIDLFGAIEMVLKHIGLPWDVLGYNTINEYVVPAATTDLLPYTLNTQIIGHRFTYNMLLEYGILDEELRDNTTEELPTYQMGQNESWKTIPEYLIANHLGYMVSDRGNMKHFKDPITFSYSSRNRHGTYKVVNIGNTNYYVHRLVWFTFNEDTPLHQRVLFKTPRLDEQGFLDCTISKLMSPKSSSWEIPLNPLPEEPIEFVHPIYGTFLINKWYPLKAHYTPKGSQSFVVDYSDSHEIMILDPDLPCVVRNKIKGNYIKIFSDQDPSISLTSNGQTNKFQLSHVVLTSVFPTIDSMTEVDHIDNNPYNNFIDNFQWVTRKENAIKNILEQAGSPRNGIEVEIYTTYGIRERFNSLEEAARAIHFVTNDSYEANAEKIAGHLADCISNPPKRLSVRGFSIRRLNVFEDLPNEIWQRYPNNPKYWISNKGRVKGKGGNLLRPRYGRNGPYSDINIAGVRYIHILVWLTFKGIIPDGEEILHNDNAPKKNGFYRNWLEDLSVGTRRLNNLQYHESIRFYGS